MRRLDLSDPAAGNLLRHAQGLDALATFTAAEIIAQLAPPATGGGSAPSGDWRAAADAFAKASGYRGAYCLEWDWSTEPLPIDTYAPGRRKWELNELVVLSFMVPEGPPWQTAGGLAIVQHPGDQLSIDRTVWITKTLDFNAKAPHKQTAQNPSLAFAIGMPDYAAFWAAISTGRWFALIANRDAIGRDTCVPGAGANYPRCDVRITGTKPRPY